MYPNYILLWFGGWEFVLAGLVILLLFGGKKIPELMKGLGKGIKEFKKSSRELAEDTEPAENPKSAENTDD